MKNTIKEEVNGFERMLTIIPPYDERHPDPSKNYGIHGTDFKMVLGKDRQYMQFVAFLPVYLPHVSQELWEKPIRTYNAFEGMGADVGYHDIKPHYEGQSVTKDCYLTGGDCYYDGSSLQAHAWYKEFLEFGIDHIWQKLEERWKDTFEEEGDEKAEGTA